MEYLILPFDRTFIFLYLLNFSLYDLIGIDLMSDVVQSLVNILPDSDPFHAEAAKIPLMTQMIENGQTGNKQGQGFYRDGDSGREVLDFESASYRNAPRLSLEVADQAKSFAPEPRRL